MEKNLGSQNFADACEKKSILWKKSWRAATIG